jgi:hypothetical protein
MAGHAAVNGIGKYSSVPAGACQTSKFAFPVFSPGLSRKGFRIPAEAGPANPLCFPGEEITTKHTKHTKISATGKNPVWLK